jgi:hypothetical protein
MYIDKYSVPNLVQQSLGWQGGYAAVHIFLRNLTIHIYNYIVLYIFCATAIIKQIKSHMPGLYGIFFYYRFT